MRLITTIKKGTHYALFAMPRLLFNHKGIQFDVTVDKSWIYDNIENNGINKILGISWGLHHDNSARVGYTCIDKIIYLYAYCYNDGQNPQTDNALKCMLYVTQPYEKITCKIKMIDGFAHFFINTYFKCAIKVNDKNKAGYLLRPYIGGTFTLDHDVKFPITNIKILS